MARRDLTAHDRAVRSRPIYWEMQQAQYVQPGNYTTDPIVMCDGTVRYIAVPPVPNTAGPTLGSNIIQTPMEMFLYRQSGEYYLRMDTSADTRNAAFFAGSVQYALPINPGVKTLSWVSVQATDNLRLNWLWGI